VRRTLLAFAVILVAVITFTIGIVMVIAGFHDMVYMGDPPACHTEGLEC
jgi:hypothetical protein